MTSNELEVFNEMPFFFWVKDSEGRYIWVNKAIEDLANGEILGKTDDELPWAENAGKLREADNKVLETGKTQYIHEYVDDSSKGKVTLNVCKFAGELDGQKCAFGISFVIDE